MAKRQKLDLVHATPAQIQELKGDIDHLERMFEADKQSGRPKIQDPEEFRNEIAKKKKVLKDHSPKRLRGENANKLKRYRDELAEKIRDRMPRSNDYFQPQPKGVHGFDFERAVKQQMDFQSNPETARMVQEWKHIGRRLDPDDPTITNVERLRRQ